MSYVKFVIFTIDQDENQDGKWWMVDKDGNLQITTRLSNRLPLRDSIPHH